MGKLDRAAPVNVVTHHIRVESTSDSNDNAIFLDPNNAPCFHEHHALFNPVDENFYDVIKARIEVDAKHGREARNRVLQHWLDEVNKDTEAGGGKSSFEKVSEMLNYGDSFRKIVCQICHEVYLYDVKSQNICPNALCRNNPTFYEQSEAGPYKKFGFNLKPPNTVRVVEQEPSDINPNGKQNLSKLYNELKTVHWDGCASFPWYGDGLPGITFERMKSEAVFCTKHQTHIQLSDAAKLAEHCQSNCQLDWPFKDLHVICGQSHEEILMNSTALRLSINFGLLDLLSDMGRHTKQAQLQAIRTKRLHTLFELNKIFMKGSMTALMVPFVTHCTDLKQKPTVKGLFKFVSESKNLRYQARFRFLIDVSLPCLIMRIGIRLNNQVLSAAASALFFPIAFAFSHSYYRDYYHRMYLNGKHVPIQESIKPTEPDITKFLNEDKASVVPNLVKFPQKNPTENVPFGLYKAKYAHLTVSSDKNDSHQGGDFLQEDQLGRVMPHLKSGKIFNIEQFAQAVRSCQIKMDSDLAEGKMGNAVHRRAKYENEVQSVASQIIDKKENPNNADDLGDFNIDTLKIANIGHENYKQFFKAKIKAIPTGSIKLKPALITKSDFTEYHKIENQTKLQITNQCLAMLEKTEFEDQNELDYYEGKIKKSNVKKDELLELFHMLNDKLVLNST